MPAVLNSFLSQTLVSMCINTTKQKYKNSDLFKTMLIGSSLCPELDAVNLVNFKLKAKAFKFIRSFSSPIQEKNTICEQTKSRQSCAFSQFNHREVPNLFNLPYSKYPQIMDRDAEQIRSLITGPFSPIKGNAVIPCWNSKYEKRHIKE